MGDKKGSVMCESAATLLVPQEVSWALGEVGGSGHIYILRSKSLRVKDPLVCECSSWHGSPFHHCTKLLSPQLAAIKAQHRLCLCSPPRKCLGVEHALTAAMGSSVRSSTVPLTESSHQQLIFIHSVALSLPCYTHFPTGPA